MALINGQKEVKYELAEAEFQRPALTSWFFAMGVLSVIFTVVITVGLIRLIPDPSFTDLSSIYILGFALFSVSMGEFVVAAVIYYQARIAFEAKQQTVYLKGIYGYARREDRRGEGRDKK